jgi:hypothetical protein
MGMAFPAGSCLIVFVAMMKAAGHTVGVSFPD